jgi:hypothetical protein
MPDTDIEISFTLTTEYTWSGPASDLPPAARKGIWRGRGDDRELNEEALSENLTDEILARLAKKAEVMNEEWSIDDAREA